jgi:hypothetical protein
VFTSSRKRETGGKQELRQKILVDLTNKTNWQQTNREHRYKYPGDNGEDKRHLEGVETSTRTGETDQLGFHPISARFEWEYSKISIKKRCSFFHQ